MTPFDLSFIFIIILANLYFAELNLLQHTYFYSVLNILNRDLKNHSYKYETISNSLALRRGTRRTLMKFQIRIPFFAERLHRVSAPRLMAFGKHGHPPLLRSILYCRTLSGAHQKGSFSHRRIVCSSKGVDMFTMGVVWRFYPARFYNITFRLSDRAALSLALSNQ